MTATFDLDIVMIVISVIGFIVWLVRLEGKVRYQEKELASVRAHVDALDSQVVEKLTGLEKAVARIEGYLQAKTEEKTDG